VRSQRPNAGKKEAFMALGFKHRWATLAALGCASATATAAAQTVRLPNQQLITPTAAHGALFTSLNPHLASNPKFTAGQAISTLLSPDGRTLLVLTSGFNQNYDATGATIAAESNEYVFVYDVSHGAPVQKQALTLPNSFVGLVFAKDGKTFFVSGGVDDSVHVFTLGSGGWSESGAPIALGHGSSGNGLSSGSVHPEAAGVALSADGKKLVVANYENDSISVVDVASRTKLFDLDLRPGKLDPQEAGIPGGEFPYGVAIKGNNTVYVSSMRDREVVVVDIAGTPKVVTRIVVQGNPNRLLLNRAQSRLFVATDNADTVDVIDTQSNAVVGRIDTSGPTRSFPGKIPVGSSPNSLAFSPDEKRLYVTNSGTNSVAVVDLDQHEHQVSGRVLGLIPTGWFPNSVSVSADGARLFVVNGKSDSGPNPGQCTGTSSDNTYAPGCPASLQNGSANSYVWQLTKAGFLTLPVPSDHELDRLTDVVATNNGFTDPTTAAQAALMRTLRSRIHHVIYIVKENRTYDQILGDIPNSNGDASITQFPAPLTPNFHAFAKQFVNLDNFYCSGEVSMDGWQWSTAARTSDINDKTTPVNYAGRGLSYDSEGTTRDFNPAFATSSERMQHNPLNPSDPDLLPGPRNEVELDGSDGEEGGGYIWNAVMRAKKSVRNYGFWIDQFLYSVPVDQGGLPLERDPFSKGLVVANAAAPELLPVTDPYFRSFDTAFPDFYRFKEWEREFDGYVKNKSLPAFEMVRLMEDHMGSFSAAIDGVNTPETQQADNDYAVGLLVDKLAHSCYAKDTLVFVDEDDSQDGPDHVNSHRSTAYVVGPYVKHGTVVSTRYATVNMLRTIEDILGVEHLNLHDAGVPPMTDVFDLKQATWTFQAEPSDILRTSTMLPLPPKPAGMAILPLHSTHPASWWAAATAGYDFSREDRNDAQAYNHVLWRGLMGDRPYPAARSELVAHDDD
jgi:DNA-binding beta-propeller fold protein YncE